jgi:hypothetical protein
MLIGRGFVGCRLGSFVESPGSIVDSVGSNVVFPGSFAASCCGIRDIPGRMSHWARHHESLCRGIRDIPAGPVAESATTRAPMSLLMRQPERRRGPKSAERRFPAVRRGSAMSIRDGGAVDELASMAAGSVGMLRKHRGSDQCGSNGVRPGNVEKVWCLPAATPAPASIGSSCIRYWSS